jgi:hypothetical protein
MKVIHSAVAALLSMAMSAHAGTAGPVKLKNIYFMSNGVVMAYVEGPRANFPACAAVESMRFALNAATPAGKAQLSGLLLAYTTGKTVSIWGTGACTAWNDTESIEFFAIND